MSSGSYGRAHPMTIFFSLGRVLYLIVIPVLRGFFTGLRGEVASWAAGAWVDMLVLLFMLAFAILSWRRFCYRYDSRGITVKSGVFFSRETTIVWGQISVLSGTSPLLLRPFRAAILHVDTIAGNVRHHDIDICLYVSTAREILEHCRSAYPSDAADFPRMTRHYAPGMRSIAAYSLLSSNSFAGIVFIATFISQTGRLLGEEFSHLLIGSFEELSRSFAVGIPPVAAAIALAVLLGWLIAFILTIVRYHGLKICGSGSKLSVSSGFFTRQAFVVDKGHVNFVDMRRTVVSLILGLWALYICVPGYAGRKDRIECLIPTRKRAALLQQQRQFFPKHLPGGRQLKPKGALAFILPALCLCAGIPTLTMLMLHIFPGGRDFIFFVMWMSLAPAFLFLALRLIDFRTGGLGRQDGGYTLRYSRGFQLHSVVLPAGNIAMVTVSRNIFQRISGKCNLTVYSSSARRTTHPCRNLWYNDVAKLLFV